MSQRRGPNRPGHHPGSVHSRLGVPRQGYRGNRPNPGPNRSNQWRRQNRRDEDLLVEERERLEEERRGLQHDQRSYQEALIQDNIFTVQNQVYNEDAVETIPLQMESVGQSDVDYRRDNSSLQVTVETVESGHHDVDYRHVQVTSSQRGSYERETSPPRRSYERSYGDPHLYQMHPDEYPEMSARQRSSDRDLVGPYASHDVRHGSLERGNLEPFIVEVDRPGSVRGDRSRSPPRDRSQRFSPSRRDRNRRSRDTEQVSDRDAQIRERARKFAEEQRMEGQHGRQGSRGRDAPWRDSSQEGRRSLRNSRERLTRSRSYDREQGDMYDRGGYRREEFEPAAAGTVYPPDGSPGRFRDERPLPPPDEPPYGLPPGDPPYDGRDAPYDDRREDMPFRQTGHDDAYSRPPREQSPHFAQDEFSQPLAPPLGDEYGSGPVLHDNRLHDNRRPRSSSRTPSPFVLHGNRDDLHSQGRGKGLSEDSLYSTVSSNQSPNLDARREYRPADRDPNPGMPADPYMEYGDRFVDDREREYQYNLQDRGGEVEYQPRDDVWRDEAPSWDRGEERRTERDSRGSERREGYTEGEQGMVERERDSRSVYRREEGRSSSRDGGRRDSLSRTSPRGRGRDAREHERESDLQRSLADKINEIRQDPNQTDGRGSDRRPSSRGSHGNRSHGNSHGQQGSSQRGHHSTPDGQRARSRDRSARKRSPAKTTDTDSRRVKRKRSRSPATRSSDTRDSSRKRSSRDTAQGREDVARRRDSPRSLSRSTGDDARRHQSPKRASRGRQEDTRVRSTRESPRHAERDTGRDSSRDVSRGRKDDKRRDQSSRDSSSRRREDSRGKRDHHSSSRQTNRSQQKDVYTHEESSQQWPLQAPASVAQQSAQGQLTSWATDGPELQGGPPPWQDDNPQGYFLDFGKDTGPSYPHNQWQSAQSDPHGVSDGRGDRTAHTSSANPNLREVKNTGSSQPSNNNTQLSPASQKGATQANLVEIPSLEQARELQQQKPNRNLNVPSAPQSFPRGMSFPEKLLLMVETYGSRTKQEVEKRVQKYEMEVKDSYLNPRTDENNDDKMVEHLSDRLPLGGLWKLKLLRRIIMECLPKRSGDAKNKILWLCRKLLRSEGIEVTEDIFTSLLAKRVQNTDTKLKGALPVIVAMAESIQQLEPKSVKNEEKRDMVVEYLQRLGVPATREAVNGMLENEQMLENIEKTFWIPHQDRRLVERYLDQMHVPITPEAVGKIMNNPEVLADIRRTLGVRKAEEDRSAPQESRDAYDDEHSSAASSSHRRSSGLSAALERTGINTKKSEASDSGTYKPHSSTSHLASSGSTAASVTQMQSSVRTSQAPSRGRAGMDSLQQLARDYRHEDHSLEHDDRQQQGKPDSLHGSYGENPAQQQRQQDSSYGGYQGSRGQQARQPENSHGGYSKDRAQQARQPENTQGGYSNNRTQQPGQRENVHGGYSKDRAQQPDTSYSSYSQDTGQQQRQHDSLYGGYGNSQTQHQGQTYTMHGGYNSQAQHPVSSDSTHGGYSNNSNSRGQQHSQPHNFHGGYNVAQHTSAVQQPSAAGSYGGYAGYGIRQPSAAVQGGGRYNMNPAFPPGAPVPQQQMYAVAPPYGPYMAGPGVAGPGTGESLESTRLFIVDLFRQVNLSWVPETTVQEILQNAELVGQIQQFRCAGMPLELLVNYLKECLQTMGYRP